MKLDKEFWNNRYIEKSTGWDIGSISTPIKNYIDQLKNYNLKILIHGCGNAHEAEYLVEKGFKNVFLLDISPLALDNFKKRLPKFPKSHLICEDFFNYQNQYDLIFEQTFFCAINPSLRSDYAKHIAKLLYPKGKIVGLLFNDKLNLDHPPFGGDKKNIYIIFYLILKLRLWKNVTILLNPEKIESYLLN